jgi:cytochrome c oxidase subunit III
MAQQHGTYYIPSPSHWPLLASMGIFIMFCGLANWLHYLWYGPYLCFTGLALVLLVMIGWFGDVIKESRAGLYDEQVDRSYRWGMVWFIFSEVCFFAAFFGALFYTRLISVPTLGGFAHGSLTHYLLWPEFKAAWPLLSNPDNVAFPAAQAVMGAWGLPAINTLILLTSGVTITVAHHGIKHKHRGQLIGGLLLTVLLGITFLCCQAYEYHEAFTELGLSLSAGIYGTVFFMLTGFHGAHVTIGTIMLIVITIRAIKGHFSPEDHFAFEGVAWYWHFVDVVWLFLFIFVYWL